MAECTSFEAGTVLPTSFCFVFETSVFVAGLELFLEQKKNVKQKYRAWQIFFWLKIKDFSWTI